MRPHTRTHCTRKGECEGEVSLPTHTTLIPHQPSPWPRGSLISFKSLDPDPRDLDLPHHQPPDPAVLPV